MSAFRSPARERCAAAWFLLSALALGALLGAPRRTAAQSPAPEYTVIRLNHPAASAVHATRINNAGLVSGTYVNGPNREGTVWNPDGTLYATIGLLPGRTSSDAHGINFAGRVAGYSEGGGFLERAVSYAPGAGMTDLSGGYRSIATDINDSNRFCGWMVDGPFRAYVHNGLSGIGASDALQSVWGLLSVALDVNNNGQVVGYDRDVANNEHAALWSPNGSGLPGAAGHTLTILLDGPAPSSSEAINDLGEVVGYHGAGTDQRAFRWNDLDGVTYPGPPGWISNAQGINSLGVAVGYEVFVTSQRAVVFDPVLGPRTLDTLIGEAPGVALHEAVGINDSGQIVCQGQALDGSTWVPASFLLTPVPQVELASFTVDPASVVGGNNVNGIITLTAPAPAGGIWVSVGSDDPSIATVPASTMLVPEGWTTVVFGIGTFPQALDETVAITASYNGVTKAAALSVDAPTPASVTLNPASIRGGNTSTLTVTLSGPAPASGISVALFGHPAATVPATATVPGGSNQAQATVTTTPVASDVNVTLTAAYNSVQAQGFLLVTAPRVSAHSVAPASVYGGAGATATVTIDSPAPAGGLSVALDSSNPSAAQVPPTVVVPANQTTAGYAVTTSPVVATTSVALNAVASGSGVSALLEVKEAQLLGISLVPTNVVSRTSGPPVDLLIRLTSGAPAGGAKVLLASSNKAVLQLPKDVTIPADQDRISIRLAPKKAGTATITAVWKSITRTTTLTVNP